MFCRRRLALVQHPMGSDRSSYKSSGSKTYADFELAVPEEMLHLFSVAIMELPEKYDYLMTQLSSSHL
jgi:hypothetical protein